MPTPTPSTTTRNTSASTPHTRALWAMSCPSLAGSTLVCGAVGVCAEKRGRGCLVRLRRKRGPGAQSKGTRHAPAGKAQAGTQSSSFSKFSGLQNGATSPRQLNASAAEYSRAGVGGSATRTPQLTALQPAHQAFCELLHVMAIAGEARVGESLTLLGRWVGSWRVFNPPLVWTR